MRVAVEAGADGTRLVVPGPDGHPEPVAVLPPGTDAAQAVDLLVGDAAGEIALVVPACDDDAVRPPGRVRAVPAPVAVLALLDRDTAVDTGRWLVVDAGRSGVSLTVVDDRGVCSSERHPCGGDRLDELVVAGLGVPAWRARAVREALSFAERLDVPDVGPVAAADLEDLLAAEWSRLVDHAVSRADGVTGIVLTGGLARTPLLPAMVESRVARPVRVLPEPDTAAVRGALALSEPRPRDVPAGAGGPAAHAGPAAAAGGRVRADGTRPLPVRPVGAPGPTGAGGGQGAGAPRRRGLRARYGVSPLVVALGAVLLGAGTVLGATPAEPVAVPAAAPGAELVQYGYAAALPSGWEHSGGDPERRRSLLGRVGSPDGVELISVERSPLGYDADVEPDRARADLGAAFRDVGGVRDLRPDVLAGRAVTRYTQTAGPIAVVDWFVLFDGSDQLVVGCRRPVRTAAPAVDRACADVVASVRTVDHPPS